MTAPSLAADPHARLSDALACLVDARTGILRHGAEEPRRPEVPDIEQMAARTGDSEAFLPHAASGMTGGCSVSRPAMLARAVERYSAAVFEEEALPLATPRAAPFPTVPRGDRALNNPAQYALPGFAWVPFTDGTPVRRTMARDLVTAGIVGGPAAVVFVPFHFCPASGEPAICQPIPTGLACHCSPQDALVGGRCAVIERDAFTITGQAGLWRAQIDRGSLSARNTDLVARLGATGARVTRLDPARDTAIPAVMAVQTHDAPEMPAISVSASAAMTAGEALRKALEAATHTARRMFHITARLGPLDPGEDFATVEGQERHLRYRADCGNRAMAGFLKPNRRPLRWATCPRRGRAIRRRSFPRRSPGSWPPGTGGRHHAPRRGRCRAFGCPRADPGPQRRIMGHRIRALGGRRLRTVPQALGRGGRDPASGDIALPHPFPRGDGHGRQALETVRDAPARRRRTGAVPREFEDHPLLLRPARRGGAGADGGPVAGAADGESPGRGAARSGVRACDGARGRGPDRPHRTAPSGGALGARLVQPGIVADSAALVAITAVFPRATFKHGVRGYRFALIEAGHPAQTLALAATATGPGMIPVGGYRDHPLDAFLDIDGVSQSAVCRAAIGRPEGGA